jgi:acyl-CoA synthetase (NDP forming)
MHKETISELDRLFYPQNIAVIGASPNIGGGKLPYFQVLKASGYAGDVYPVNPSHKEIEGVKVFPSINDLPDGVDLAIVQVPVRLALETVEEVVKKGIKFVHFFTSGFSEAGKPELEEAIVNLARSGGTRIVGPNCLGVLCQESGVTFHGRVRRGSPGRVAFLSQSGGVSENFLGVALSRRIRLNKVVSYGNQIDLRVEDFLEYFSGDETIGVVAAYIEDIKDGAKFLEVLKEIVPKKPVIILKGGSTEQGARAATSHTGAMSGPHHIFSAAIRQYGCIEVQSFEQLVDTVMMAGSAIGSVGPRIGFLGAGGGTSVLFTDIAASHGFMLPELQESTRESIMKKITMINTSATNPVDLGAYGLDLNIMAHTMNALDADKNIDVIIPYFSIDFLSSFPHSRQESAPLLITEAAKEIEKPVIPILSKFTEDDTGVEEVRTNFFSKFREAGLPVYGDMQSVIGAIKNMLQWKAQ